MAKKVLSPGRSIAARSPKIAIRPAPTLTPPPGNGLAMEQLCRVSSRSRANLPSSRLSGCHQCWAAGARRMRGNSARRVARPVGLSPPGGWKTTEPRPLHELQRRTHEPPVGPA
jgi:hypothetical protein